MMHFGWVGRGWSSMMGGGLGMILFWILIVIGIIYLVNNTDILNNNENKYREKKVDEEDPMEIARNRYAKGEIDKEEFEEIKENIRK